MLALAMAANKCSKRPSEFVGIDDESIALAFDIRCATELTRWEMEQQSKLMEAMVGASITKPLQVEGKATRRIRQ